MKQNVHRSDNLLISLSDDGKELEFEIRFSMSYARGRCDATCPRCHAPVAPSRWEIEGPEALGNTVWFVCRDTLSGTPACETGPDGTDELRWTRRVDFSEGWVDLDN